MNTELASTLPLETQNIIAEEQDLLLNVRQGLLILAAEESEKNYHSENFQQIIELRDSLADTLQEDVPAVMAQMERMILLQSQQNSQNQKTQYNLENPYFAHIRLKENKRVRDLLIGNQNCFSTHLPCPIVDWKHAPISQIFYRYREGDEYVEEIDQRELEGELIVRRTLLIEDGILKRIHWPGGILEKEATNQHGQNGWIVSSHQQPHLQSGSDHTLSQFQTKGKLSIAPDKQNSASSSSKYKVDKHLQQITALVDSDQFDVITHPESGIVLIQGGAGSGKTTVALHRLAYLMSKRPNYFKPKTVLPIVFGAALANYMSKVLPALGVQGVKPRIYQHWVAGLRREAFPDLPNSYAENTPMDVIELKRHPLWLIWYREEVAKKTEMFHSLILEGFKDVENYRQVLDAWEALSRLPLIPRLKRLMAWAQGKEKLAEVAKNSNPQLFRRMHMVFEQAFPELLTEPQMMVSQIWNDCLVNKEQLLENIERLAPGEFTNDQLESAWGWAIRQYQKRQESKEIPETDRRSLVEEVEGLGRMQSQFVDDKALLDEEDDTLLLLLHQLLLGPLRRSNGKALRYTHLMLDEAQDFGSLEFQLLISLTPENLTSVTLAGDLDQRIVMGRRHETWEESLSHLTLPNGSVPDVTALSPLKIGYRSTHEIMSVAKNIIGEYSSNTEWHSTRHGLPVETFRFKEQGAMVAFLSEALDDFTTREPLISVVVLARTPEIAEQLYSGLKRSDLPGLRLIRNQEFSFTPGIDVTDIAQTKGLEFDTTIIVDADASTYGPDIHSRHILYVGTTRAAHQLWLLHCGNPSSLISQT